MQWTVVIEEIKRSNSKVPYRCQHGPGCQNDPVIGETALEAAKDYYNRIGTNREGGYYIHGIPNKITVHPLPIKQPEAETFERVTEPYIRRVNK